MKGIVSGILSGDSLIIRFVNKPTQVVCLEYLMAPKFGRPDGKYQDEPFGYDSWAFLRDNCIGKRVLVTEAHTTMQNRTHPAFGKEPLPVIFTRIRLNDTDEDVGLLMCKAGWVKMREAKPNTHFSNEALEYMDQLKAAQEEAERNKRGMWSGQPGFIRPFPIRCNPDDIMARREFDCNIDQIKSTNSFSVFVLPTHENINITLPGIRPLKNTDENMRNAIREQSRNKFLNKKVRVHIFQPIEYQAAGETPSFIGCFLDEKLDKAVAHTIEVGFAVINKKNLDLAPNPDLYIRKQIIAQNNKAGCWKNEVFEMPQVPTSSMSGMITSVKGSNSFYLIVDGQKKVVTLNNIKVPRFNSNVGCESCGYEAREFLRTQFNKKVVTVEVDAFYEDRMYGTVMYKGVSVNEVLCENGLAEYDDPVCGIPSSRVEQIKRAQEYAKGKAIGIWAAVKPEPIQIIDCSQKDLAREPFNYIQEHKKVKCIIEHIYSSSRFTALIPEKMWLIKVSLNGLASLSVQDKFGHDAKLYCLDRFLQTEVEIEAVSLDDYTSFIWVHMNLCDNNKTDVAIDILSHGFSEIQTRHLAQEEISQELKDAQQIAKSQAKGIWADRTRHQFELIPGKSYQVQVVDVWSPTHLAVQHRGPEMQRIESILKTATTKLTEQPLKNDCLVYTGKNGSQRVRIENVNNEEQKAKVKFIDTDVDDEVSFSDLYKLPPELYNIPPQGRSVKQASFKYNDKSEEEKARDCQEVMNLVRDAALYMQLVSNDESGPYVVLLDREAQIEGAVCLGIPLLQKNMVTYVEDSYPPELESVFNMIREYSLKNKVE